MEVDLHQLDDALIRLRRLWGASRHRLAADGTSPVEMSSLLVVETCARGADLHHEVTVGDVADLADVTASTASRLVDRAEAAGLLHRTPSAVNARRTALVLTPAGSALRRRAVAARTAWLAEQVREWDPVDVERLGELLARFADGMHAGAADADRPAPHH